MDSIHARHAGLRYSLIVEQGVLTRLELVDEARGVSWAGAEWDFLWALRQGDTAVEATTVVVSNAAQSSDEDAHAWQFTLTPRFPGPATPACHLDLQVRLSLDGAWIEEQLTICNSGAENLTVTALRAMLSRAADAAGLHYFPIPFQECRARPEPIDLSATTDFECFRDAAVLRDGHNGLVVARQLVDTYEEPQLIGVRCNAERISFGGLVDGIPSGTPGFTLAPNETRDFGATRYIPYSGSLEDGLIHYRDHMARCGVCLPDPYAPPLNYCIYYECRDRYHHVQLREALQRAADLGCALLYTDQGWEDYFGSGRWDTTRLGPIEDFIGEAKALGLEVGVLIGMHTDAYVWPAGYARLGADGKTAFGDKWGAGHSIGICSSVPGWQVDKTERLRKVVDAGVSFFSFDFNDNLTPCHDPNHGHRVPQRSWEHSLGVARQQQQMKQACPSVLIEAHDWEFAGSCTWPVYLFRDGHDELWGFEFMWDPFSDFTTGRLMNLYYYNMAYELPLYLHIDLARDSEHAIVFWYTASTVRHLGIGNAAALNEDRLTKVKAAVAIYREHQPFFSAGRFDGLDPLTHIHTRPGQGAIVLRFNDQDAPVEGELELTANKVGGESHLDTVTVLVGAPVQTTVDGDRLRISYTLQNYDVLVLKIG